MKSWKDKLERIIAAITFADLNYPAVKPVRGEAGALRPRPQKGILGKLDRIMLAMTFAEANCHDIAAEFVEPAHLPKRAAAGRETAGPAFAEVLGLRGVRVWYGVVDAG